MKTTLTLLIVLIAMSSCTVYEHKLKVGKSEDDQEKRTRQVKTSLEDLKTTDLLKMTYKVEGNRSVSFIKGNVVEKDSAGILIERKMLFPNDKLVRVSYHEIRSIKYEKDRYRSNVGTISLLLFTGFVTYQAATFTVPIY